MKLVYPCYNKYSMIFMQIKTILLATSLVDGDDLIKKYEKNEVLSFFLF